MSKHVTEWLGPYLDGELRAARREYVHAHLAACAACQAELESLRALSRMLQDAPAPVFSSPDRFAAAVALRLPPSPAALPRRTFLEAGWWFIPVGLLAIWVFMNTSLLVSNLLSLVLQTGLLAGVPDWLLAEPATQAYWSATLGRLGFPGGSLDAVSLTEAFTRASLGRISAQASIALLYLSWIAVWWATHSRRAYSLLRAE